MQKKAKKSNNIKGRLPAEWEKQTAVQLTWPHAKNIWQEDFPKIINLFVSLSKIMISHTRLIIICLRASDIKSHFTEKEKKRIIFVEAKSNDIWARDHSLISLIADENIFLLNFIFNGWGLKFAAHHDNLLNLKLKQSSIFSEMVSFKDMSIVFEGGSIDSNGKGEALTTSTCIFSLNRNEHIPKADLIRYLKDTFNLSKLHILNHGYLQGDDTDSHIDMLARFVDETTIVHAICNDRNDEHYESLQKMKFELEKISDIQGNKYKLIGIPIGKVIHEDARLPASYINFLLINDAVLVPQYNVSEDKIAVDIFSELFKDRVIIPIDCTLLIRQGGSLHCATMNFYEGTLN